MASDDVIEWLAGLEREATPGPWAIEREELSADFDDEDQKQAYPERVGPLYIEHVDSDVSTVEADARLIATLRTVAPELLAVVRAVGTLDSETDGFDPRYPLTYQNGLTLRDAIDALRARLEEVRRG